LRARQHQREQRRHDHPPCGPEIIRPLPSPPRPTRPPVRGPIRGNCVGRMSVVEGSGSPIPPLEGEVAGRRPDGGVSRPERFDYPHNRVSYLSSGQRSVGERALGSRTRKRALHPSPSSD
jgi:hypothetical protein